MGTETGSQLHTFHSSYKLMEHMEVGYELGGKKDIQLVVTTGKSPPVRL